MQCPRCLARNREGRRFCAECGAPLALLCNSCGFSNEPAEKFCGGCGQPLTPSGRTHEPSAFSTRAYTPSHLAVKILTSKSVLEGERKQVTVLFADLKDSTELIRGLDPEVAQRLLDPALRHMMDAVHRFEGTVNQVLGDGIMALFGAPIAHEDHALRACYAALAMQAAMRAYTEEVRRAHGLEMRIRVGLNSGEVVVRAIGNDLHMDYSAVGETTHLAARMEQLATPGSIRLTAATLRLVEGLVQVNALGPVPVKGLAEPVEVFELLGASGTQRRVQAAAARGLTRFVGRQTEMATLTNAMAQAEAGHGQVVALVGEAGVGKSRLVYELTHSHHIHGWLVLESASVSYGKATPYFPVIDLLKRYAHVEEHDDPRTIRAKVTGQVLTLDEALQDTIPALLSLLEALLDDSSFLQLDPSQRRQRTLTALKRVLLRESRVQPLVLLFEDLHWIDSETQALLDSLVESLPTVRVLLLVNYRPEYQHGWGAKTYYTQVRLDPLPLASAEELLQVLLGDDSGLVTLKRLLIARTEGNPFFLEESVWALVETAVLEGNPGAYHLVPRVGVASRGRSAVANHRGLPLPIDIHMPATVQAVLAARIDRLPPEEKRLLQTAAVIGNEIPLPLLQTVGDLPEEALHRGLAHLQAAEFLYETRLFPEQEYTFKHALTHEVAYGSLLQERRRALHARIVEALEALVPDRAAEQVERLAHHALRGEVWDRAVTYCRQAGAKAAERSALLEAATAFEQALTALQHLPDRRVTREQAIDLRFDLRNVLHPLGESERILNYLRQAEPLAEALGDQRRLGQLAGYMSVCLRHQGNVDDALATAQRALTIATGLGDVGLQVAANSFLGELYLWVLNDYPQAAEAFRRNVETLHGAQLRERFGTTNVQSVVSRAQVARSLAELGAFAEGRAYGEDALRLAETVDHPYSLVWACEAVGYFFLRQGALSQAIRVFERGLGLREAVNFPTVIRQCNAGLGAAYTLSGRVTEALPLLQRALEQSQALSGPRGLEPLFPVWLGEGYLLSGHLAEAMQLGRRALEATGAQKQPGYQAYALRLLGDIAAQGTPLEVAQAADHYHRALALATELGMRPLQAHCHFGLGTLYTKIGQCEQARTELSAATELYRAMEMTFWLPQAEAALAEAT